MAGDICKNVESVCPPTDKIYELLREKRKLAAQIYPGRPRARGKIVMVDVSKAFQYAVKVYGKLQKADMSEPPPPPNVISKAIIHSVPGLFACLHARYYCEQGLLNNKFISLVGSGGMGKSTFAILLAASLGGYVFTKEDDVLKGVMGLLARNEWAPVIVFDDIAAIISKYWYMSKRERAWRNFFKMIEYLKDISGITLVTARAFEGEARRFRELTEITGKIDRFYMNSMIVDVVTWSEAEHKTPDYVDVLWPGLKLPQEVWDKMQRRRRIRSRILVLETLLELAEQGEVRMDEEERERIIEQLDKLYEELHKV